MIASMSRSTGDAAAAHAKGWVSGLNSTLSTSSRKRELVLAPAYAGGTQIEAFPSGVLVVNAMRPQGEARFAEVRDKSSLPASSYWRPRRHRARKMDQVVIDDAIAARRW